MDSQNILAYGGIAVLIILLIVLELKEGRIGRQAPYNGGYEYYTADNGSVRIRHVFGSLYKVYVLGNCPVPTKQDRFGTCFTVRAHSASEAEYIIDGMYQQGSADLS